MRRLVTLSLLVLLIGLTGYQASAANERASSALGPKGPSDVGVAAYPSGTWNAAVNIQNPTTSSATVQVKLYDANGNLISSTGLGPDTIAAGGSKTYVLGNIADIPAGKYSAVVESDQAVVAVTTETNYAGAKGIGDAYNGISSGATTLRVPVVYVGYSSWYSMVAVQNTDPSNSGTVSLTFYRQGEATAAMAAKTYTIAPLASKTFDLASSDFSGLLSGSNPTFLGALTITGTTNIAAVAHSYKDDPSVGDVNIFRAVTSGATKFYAPVIYNQYSPSDTTGWTSSVNVQNLGSTAANVTLSYSLDPRSGQTGTYSKTISVPANSLGAFYMPWYTEIPAGTYGSATITSDGNQIAVIATATKYALGVGTAYNAFADGSGSSKVVAPVMYNKWNPNADSAGWTSAINIQNLGSSADTVTMRLTVDANSVGSGTVPGPYTISKPVAANGSVTFYLPDFNASDAGNMQYGIYGVAEFTATGGQKILGVVTNTKYANTLATSYVGVNQ